VPPLLAPPALRRQGGATAENGDDEEENGHEATYGAGVTVEVEYEDEDEEDEGGRAEEDATEMPPLLPAAAGTGVMGDQLRMTQVCLGVWAGDKLRPA
jgi:hypothetical protein